MKQLTGNQIRQMFLDYFKSKGHMIEPGASLIPHNDPTLLWINAGVAALKKYFDGNGGIKDDEMYIFTGDYIDRGVENADVVKFLISIKDKKNVLMLEGNHERWLWLWANDCVGKSKEFELVTRPQLDDAKIDKKDVRQLYRKLGQCAYYKYGENIYLVTHAGLSILPNKSSFQIKTCFSLFY